MPPPPPLPPAAAIAGSRAPAQPCLRSHGKEVARLHLLDWIVLVLLVVTYAVLGLVQPFHRFVAEDMMATLRYPMKGNTVPSWAVPIIAIVVPMVVFIGIYMKRRNVYDLHHGILGVLFSVLITAILTVAIKDAVGRPRPDFFWRCFPDGVPKYNNITGDVICHGNPNVIREGHKSFPSGHASGSFAGLGFLSWYLAGKIKVFDRRGHVAKLCIVLVPLLLASMVAVSRDWWLLRFATFSSFHYLTVNMDFGRMHTMSTIVARVVKAKCNQQTNPTVHQASEMRTTRQALDSVEVCRDQRFFTVLVKY